MGAATLPAWGQALLAVAKAHVHAPAADAGAWTPRVLSPHQDQTVIALSEAILPATDTPGAKAALVNRYVDAVLDDADDFERKAFLRGLDWVDDRSRELFGSDFLSSLPEQQAALLAVLGSGKNRSAADRAGVELFETLKSLTLTGYYTSEVGMREELKDDGMMFFGGFEGCTHPEHGGGKARSHD
jgi:hypothetical protein